jgi:hypothetical protein
MMAGMQIGFSLTGSDTLRGVCIRYVGSGREGDCSCVVLSFEEEEAFYSVKSAGGIHPAIIGCEI